MDMILWIGTAAVAGGLGAAAMGVGRAVELDTGAQRLLDIVHEGGTPTARSADGPFAARLFAPAWLRFEKMSRAAMPSWWIERLRRNTRLAGLGTLGLDGALAMKAAFATAGVMIMPLL